MFGMLDYRAYKLFWLLTFPFRILRKALYFMLVGIAIWIGIWSEFQPLVLQMVIAYVAFEGMGIVLVILWTILIILPVDKMFFWIVDVIPARGENIEEAKEIVRKGPAIWLTKKMTNHIDEWTFEDTDAFVSLMNWRARLFFNEREKFEKRIAILERVYYDTGKQPSELGENEVAKLLKPYKANWFETAIVNPHFVNSIMAATIIIGAILYLSPSHSG
jgi:hypothetical protein